MRKAYNKGIYFGRRVSLFFLFGLFSFPLLGSVVSLSLVCVVCVAAEVAAVWCGAYQVPDFLL